MSVCTLNFALLLFVEKCVGSSKGMVSIASEQRDWTGSTKL